MSPYRGDYEELLRFKMMYLLEAKSEKRKSEDRELLNYFNLKR